MPSTSVYSQSECDPVLASICRNWMAKLRLANQYKQKVFGLTADECMEFYHGPRNWDRLMHSQLGDGGMQSRDGYPSPDFKVVVNKTAEFVDLFGPTLYYENPVRLARPRAPASVPPDLLPAVDPMMQQALWQSDDRTLRLNGLKGVLLESYLNYLPDQFDLQRHSRWAIQEALIKGRGCLWSSLYIPPSGGRRYVRSYFDSVDRLLVDPDSPAFEDAMWISQQHIRPVWQVERDWGLRRGSLKGNYESMTVQSIVPLDENLQYDRRRGFTNDLLVYYEVWSKMGIGGRMSGVPPSYRGPLEQFGDYCYLVVSESVPFPLNLSPDIQADPSMTADDIYARVAWPTPYWGKGWPVAVLDFHHIAGCPWPMAPLKKGMGELKFLNWMMSFLMGKMRTTCRDFIGIRKSASQEIKDTILQGKDLALLEIEAESPSTIQEIVTFLQHPQMNSDVWHMIDYVSTTFDKRMGLTEIMYGMPGATQARSAYESKTREQGGSIRPEDMARQAEAWMSEIAKKEAITARYHLRGNDVAHVLGTSGAIAWDQYVATTDVELACRELEYRIEAGSSQRPNKEYQTGIMIQTYNAIGPVLQAYAQSTGDVEPLNNLLSDLARSQALQPDRYLLHAPPPPPQPAQTQASAAAAAGALPAPTPGPGPS